jgi:GT2 family glycosyltransferase
MISIIISTHNQEFIQSVSQNIKETIGVEYEIIAIENHNKYSICEAYNLGSERANYPYLCFMHEDVLLKTHQWGTRLIDIMTKDSTIGLIGIAGSKFKSTYPTTGWGTGPFVTRFWRGHHYKGRELQLHVELDKSTNKKEIDDVLIVDGVFMFTRKEVLNTCRFDEKILTHFHGYDTDFSLQVFTNSFRVVVYRGLELIHFSYGDLGDEFAKANRIIQKKWQSKLPIATKDSNLNTFQLFFYNTLTWTGYLLYAFKRKLKNRFN